MAAVDTGGSRQAISLLELARAHAETTAARVVPGELERAAGVAMLAVMPVGELAQEPIGSPEQKRMTGDYFEVHPHPGQNRYGSSQTQLWLSGPPQRSQEP